MTHELMGRQNGAAIRAFRKKDKLTLARLAAFVGLQNKQSLVNIENGRRPAGDDVIRDLARVLNVPIQAIMRDGTDGGLDTGDMTDEAAEPEGAAAA
jgi:transcriptional regulator with XRE-family HTH domain